jgi:intein/homing endonuclease
MPDELQKYPTEDIIRILSKLPDFLRESMMNSRLQELCAKDSKTQDEFIDSILDGLSSADKETLTKVIRTWLVVVSKLESSKVSTIFSSFISRYENDPSMYESNYSAILLEEYQSLKDDQRIVLRDQLVEAALNQYRGRQLMLTLPEQVRSALEV